MGFWVNSIQLHQTADDLEMGLWVAKAAIDKISTTVTVDATCQFYAIECLQIRDHDDAKL
jgi:hypothetical protein